MGYVCVFFYCLMSKFKLFTHFTVHNWPFRFLCRELINGSTAKFHIVYQAIRAPALNHAHVSKRAQKRVSHKHNIFVCVVLIGIISDTLFLTWRQGLCLSKHYKRNPRGNSRDQNQCRRPTVKSVCFAHAALITLR